MKEKKLITTRKWVSQSKTTKRLPLVIFSDAACFKELLKYRIPSGLIFYQPSLKDNKFIINFGFGNGTYSKAQVTKASGRDQIIFTYAMRSNLKPPKAFQKSTAIPEKNIKLEKDRLIVDLDVDGGNGSTPTVNRSSVNPIDNKSLSKQIVSELNDKFSYQLASAITQQLTRSDKFMNRVAETVGFKLASTISTRTNRLSESLNSTIKDQSDKSEKRITHNVYDLFKEAGWLK
ncbi:hypothetical protein [Limosilactobacillus agrestimuris]|uniref:hypothetical protein n=1 Tax=Limosilactobacillus agrestimuris TaxID=2941331 RepID=UPI00203ED441|nr:hypothetical protein [Limosilactobacillus agrestimuris]